MDQLISTPFRDVLLDPAVRQAIRLKQRDRIQHELLGDFWREEKTTVRSAAKFLRIDKSLVYHNLRARNGSVTIGKVWDEHVRRSGLPTPRDFDNLAAWSQLHGWPLNAERHNALRFLRTASAARVAGLDLSTAEVITKALYGWGIIPMTAHRWANIKGTYYQFWAGKVKRLRVARRGDDGGHTLRVWRVSDLLDWFLISTEPIPAMASDMDRQNQDAARNCYRSVVLNIKRYHRAPDTWNGACQLQRAWNWYWKLMDIEIGRRPGEANVNARRLDTYISQTIQALAEVDPDWQRPPLDTSGIAAEKYYPVWVPPGPPARSDIVHAPASCRLLQIVGDGEGHRQPAQARDKALRMGIDTGRVTYVRGQNIINKPHAYTR